MKNLLVVARHNPAEALRVAAGLTLLSDPVRVAVVGIDPARDPATILLARQEGKGVEELRASEPQPETASSVIRNFPPEKSAAVLEMLTPVGINDYFGAHFGPMKTVDRTDGLRITFETDEVVHLRPSGNAPEFRVYTEAGSEERATEVNGIAKGVIERMI